MKIYVCYGATGEYSNWDEWTIAAYESEGMAKAHIAAAEKWYQEHDCYKLRNEREFHNPFDPHMGTDYTGTRWYVGMVELRTSLPTIENPMPKSE
jgi:hypothetical protein